MRILLIFLLFQQVFAQTNYCELKTRINITTDSYTFPVGQTEAQPIPSGHISCIWAFYVTDGFYADITIKNNFSSTESVQLISLLSGHTRVVSSNTSDHTTQLYRLPAGKNCMILQTSGDHTVTGSFWFKVEQKKYIEQGTHIVNLMQSQPGTLLNFLAGQTTVVQTIGDDVSIAITLSEPPTLEDMENLDSVLIFNGSSCSETFITTLRDIYSISPSILAFGHNVTICPINSVSISQVVLIQDYNTLRHYASYTIAPTPQQGSLPYSLDGTNGKTAVTFVNSHPGFHLTVDNVNTTSPISVIDSSPGKDPIAYINNSNSGYVETGHDNVMTTLQLDQDAVATFNVGSTYVIPTCGHKFVNTSDTMFMFPDDTTDKPFYDGVYNCSWDVLVNVGFYIEMHVVGTISSTDELIITRRTGQSDVYSGVSIDQKFWEPAGNFSIIFSATGSGYISFNITTYSIIIKDQINVQVQPGFPAHVIDFSNLIDNQYVFRPVLATDDSGTSIATAVVDDADIESLGSCFVTGRLAGGEFMFTLADAFTQAKVAMGTVYVTCMSTVNVRGSMLVQAEQDLKSFGRYRARYVSGINRFAMNSTDGQDVLTVMNLMTGQDVALETFEGSGNLSISHGSPEHQPFTTIQQAPPVISSSSVLTSYRLLNGSAILQVNGLQPPVTTPVPSNQYCQGIKEINIDKGFSYPPTADKSYTGINNCQWTFNLERGFYGSMTVQGALGVGDYLSFYTKNSSYSRSIVGTGSTFAKLLFVPQGWNSITVRTKASGSLRFTIYKDAIPNTFTPNVYHIDDVTSSQVISLDNINNNGIFITSSTEDPTDYGIVLSLSLPRISSQDVLDSCFIFHGYGCNGQFLGSLGDLMSSNSHQIYNFDTISLCSLIGSNFEELMIIEDKNTAVNYPNYTVYDYRNYIETTDLVMDASSGTYLVSIFAKPDYHVVVVSEKGDPIGIISGPIGSKPYIWLQPSDKMPFVTEPSSDGCISFMVHAGQQASISFDLEYVFPRNSSQTFTQDTTTTVMFPPAAPCYPTFYSGVYNSVFQIPITKGYFAIITIFQQLGLQDVVIIAQANQPDIHISSTSPNTTVFYQPATTTLQFVASSQGYFSFSIQWQLLPDYPIANKFVNVGKPAQVIDMSLLQKKQLSLTTDPTSPGISISVASPSVISEDLKSCFVYLNNDYGVFLFSLYQAASRAQVVRGNGMILCLNDITGNNKLVIQNQLNLNEIDNYRTIQVDVTRSIFLSPSNGPAAISILTNTNFRTTVVATNIFGVVNVFNGGPETTSVGQLNNSTNTWITYERMTTYRKDDGNTTLVIKSQFDNSTTTTPANTFTKSTVSMSTMAQTTVTTTTLGPVYDTYCGFPSISNNSTDFYFPNNSTDPQPYKGNHLCHWQSTVPDGSYGLLVLSGVLGGNDSFTITRSNGLPDVLDRKITETLYLPPGAYSMKLATSLSGTFSFKLTIVKFANKPSTKLVVKVDEEGSLIDFNSLQKNTQLLTSDTNDTILLSTASTDASKTFMQSCFVFSNGVLGNYLFNLYDSFIQYQSVTGSIEIYCAANSSDSTGNLLVQQLSNVPHIDYLSRNVIDLNTVVLSANDKPNALTIINNNSQVSLRLEISNVTNGQLSVNEGTLENKQISNLSSPSTYSSNSMLTTVRLDAGSAVFTVSTVQNFVQSLPVMLTTIGLLFFNFI